MDPGSRSPLVVAVDADALFAAAGEARALERPGDDEAPLGPGPGLALVQALLAHGHGGVQGAQIVVVSSRDADRGLPVLASLRRLAPGVERTVFCGGEPRARYLRAFEVDLLLTRDEAVAREAAEEGTPSALVQELERPADASDPIRMALDVDALAAPHDGARDDGRLEELASLARRLRAAAEAAGRPLRVALVGARGAGEHERALRGLVRSGLAVDEAFSLAGLPREGVLRAFGAQLVLDARHLPQAAEHKPRAPVAARDLHREPGAGSEDARIDTPFSRLRGRWAAPDD